MAVGDRLELQDQSWVRHHAMTHVEAARVVRLLGMPRAIGRLVVGVPHAKLSAAGEGVLRVSDAPRLHVVIGGTFRLCGMASAGPFDTVLSRGDAAYWLAGAWSVEPWDRPGEIIGATLLPTQIRLIRMRNPRRPEAEGRDLAAWHSERPLSGAGMSIAALLGQLAMEAAYFHALGPIFGSLIAVMAHELQPLVRSEPAPGAAGTWSRAQSYIEDHLGESIDRTTVARALGIHPNHLSRLAAAQAGMAFKDALRLRRLGRAEQLLRDTDLPLARVATACGWANADHFAKVFRQARGMSPGRFRAQLAAR